jgi:hypothetical protein
MLRNLGLQTVFLRYRVIWMRRRVAQRATMSISDPADLAQVEPNSAHDQEARLPLGAAVMAIVVLSATTWAAVVIVAVGIWAALR